MLETKVLLCPTNHLSAVMLSCTHTQEQPEDTENRKQLALQGLHISGLSQCAPKYSCPSCPISSSETSGSFLPPAHPSSAYLNHSSPPWPGPSQASRFTPDSRLHSGGSNRKDTCGKTEGGGESVSSSSSTSYGREAPKEASRPHLRMLRAHRWAAVTLNPIAITKDSRSSDSGRLVGGATHTDWR